MTATHLYIMSVFLFIFLLLTGCDKEGIDDYLVPTCGKVPSNQADPWEDGGDKDGTIQSDSVGAGFDIKIDPWHSGKTDTLLIK